MAYITLRRPRAEQPRGEVLLDQNHWLTKDVTFAFTGDAPWFNSAEGKAYGISRGGSGFSQRGTSKGNSLWTPDGGWADIAVGQDWIGPNTIIALCRINGIDTWGGLFSKDSSGSSTQFAVGQENNTGSLYGAVENGTAVSFGGASIAALANFSVIAFTHSGVTSSAMSYYRNGALAGSTTALGAQNSGAGVLGLGRSRDSSASFDSDVDWLGFIRVQRVLSATETAEVSRNIWAVWKAQPRRIWVSASASSEGAGSASGTSTVSGIGASTANSIAASSGVATVSGVGTAVIGAVGSASGVATVDGVGTSSTGSSGSASGTCSVSGAGSSTAASNGVANGVASASGIGASTASSTATSTGIATVSGVGDSIQAGSAVGGASGTSTVSGVGASVVSAIGNASGDCNVSGAGAKTGGEVESFSGGYLYDDTRESHAERKRKKRIELGIEEEEKPVSHVLPNGLERFEISNLVDEKPVLPNTKKQHIPARQQKKLAEQEAENAELKRLIQLEVEREEETILRFLMEL